MSEFLSKESAERQLENLEALSEEIKAMGAVIGDVAFEMHEENGEGVGIFAASSLVKGSVLVQVPYSLCLSVDAILACEELRSLFVEQEQLLQYPDEVLAIGLMYGALESRKEEQREAEAATEATAAPTSISSSSCPWATHIRTLPSIESFNTTLYWTSEELAELKGCTVYHLTQMMLRQIDADWSNIHEPLSNVYPHLLAGITKDLYKWALSIIYSRAVGLTRREKYVRVIPPVLDMANHDPYSGEDAADTFNFNEESDTLTLVSTSDKDEGDECFAVYGQYPNAKLAYTYGFVIHACPHRAVDLWAKVTSTTSLAERKQSILQNHALTATQVYDFTGTLREKYISPALLATVRVIQATEEELDGDIENAYMGAMVSTRNEMATLASLASLLQARVNAEAAEADKTQLGEMLLDSTHPSNRLLMALIIRVDERDLAQECYELVLKCMTDLEEQGELYKPLDAPQVDLDV